MSFRARPHGSRTVTLPKAVSNLRRSFAAGNDRRRDTAVATTQRVAQLGHVVSSTALWRCITCTSTQRPTFHECRKYLLVAVVRSTANEFPPSLPRKEVSNLDMSFRGLLCRDASTCTSTQHPTFHDVCRKHRLVAIDSLDR